MFSWLAKVMSQSDCKSRPQFALDESSFDKRQDAVATGEHLRAWPKWCVDPRPWGNDPKKIQAPQDAPPLESATPGPPVSPARGSMTRL